MSGITLSTRPKTPVIFNSDRFTGAAGEPGTPGQDGLSAYEVAVANGFDGTVEEWLLSLVGPQGEPGETPDLSSYLTKTEASETYATLAQLGDIDNILDILNGDLEGDIQEIIDNMVGV